MKIHYIFIISFVFYSCVSTSTNKSIPWKEKLVSSAIHKIDSLHVIFYGSSVSRIFVEGLYDRLQSKLIEKNVSITYSYLGASLTEARSRINSIIDRKSTFILLIQPLDSVSFHPEASFRNKDLLWADPNRSLPYQAAQSSFNYKQSLGFKLVDLRYGNTGLWNCKVDLDIDLSTSKLPADMADFIVRRYKKHGFISKE